MLVLSSCSEFTKLQKKGSFEEKFTAAMAYFEEEEYYKAGLLLDDIYPFSIGTPEAEKIHLTLAKCQYEQGSLMMATHYFQSFTEKYPRSPEVEEANYLHIKGLYFMSATHNLDQTQTYRAIDAIQEFLNTYPDTPYKSKCNDKMDELQYKLELKDYENAKLHLKIEHYRAAVIAFESFINQYPASDFNEELEFLKIKAQYLFAKNSAEKLKKDNKIYYLKKERLEQAVSYYRSFIDTYTESSYLGEAENLFKNIESLINNLENS